MPTDYAALLGSWRQPANIGLLGQPYDPRGDVRPLLGNNPLETLHHPVTATPSLPPAARQIDWAGLGYNPQQARAMGLFAPRTGRFGFGGWAGGNGGGRSVGRGSGGYGQAGPGGLLGHI